MDTKSKKISRHIAIKSLAFIITALLIGTIVSLIFYIDTSDFNLEALVYEDFIESPTFSYTASDALHRTYWYFDEGDPIYLENIEYIYYISDGEKTLTNREGYGKSDFAKYKDTYISYENGIIDFDENYQLYNRFRNFHLDEGVTIYIAFEDSYMRESQADWQAQRDTLIPIAVSIISSLILALALIIYLIAVSGRKPMSDELHSNWLDRIYTEILLASFVPVAFLWLLINSEFLYRDYDFSTTEQIIHTIIIGGNTVLAATICGIISLALVRKIKDKRFIKDLFLYRIYYTITDFIKSFLDGRRYEKFPLTKVLHLRQIIFIVASFFLVLSTFLSIWSPLALLFPLLELVLIYWYIKYNNQTYDEINKGFDESLEEQMKAERMKIELITNVSHDLKTPLTSIISYVDLLSKDEELSESAKDYVKILAEKSNRLKNIVSDLFDLAKSTSGDINLELETLDFKKLIQQTLGDMEDNIEKSGIQIKTNMPEGSVNIYTDGKKMYRVLQNIIDNALKYSLDGTRIFIDLEEINGRGIATIKNISNYEMDFSPEEILERFNRGDKSRTTDGSGLGLSIAESFTRVCGGDLKIDIDGDMFKVIISFNLVQ